MAPLGQPSGLVQEAVKSGLGHRLGRQQERWKMILREDQRKYEGRKDRRITKGWTKKYKFVPYMVIEEKEKTSKSMLDGSQGKRV